MTQTQLLMGMPICVEIIGMSAPKKLFSSVYDFFSKVDARYSTYKPDSEISQINRGLPKAQWSKQMKSVLAQCNQTKRASGGYFDITHNGQLDPSGLVKGWAIDKAADLLRSRGVKNFYIDAGGDIQVSGQNVDNQPWQVGIKNPFNQTEIIKTVAVTQEGVATSGSYIRGQHIYNPLAPDRPIQELVSLTVIGPNIYEADRFATAAYAMGKKGIRFIEKLKGFEGYMVAHDKTATLTSGFERYVVV